MLYQDYSVRTLETLARITLTEVKEELNETIENYESLQEAVMNVEENVENITEENSKNPPISADNSLEQSNEENNEILFYSVQDFLNNVEDEVKSDEPHQSVHQLFNNAEDKVKDDELLQSVHQLFNNAEDKVKDDELLQSVHQLFNNAEDKVKDDELLQSVHQLFNNAENEIKQENEKQPIVNEEKKLSIQNNSHNVVVEEQINFEEKKEDQSVNQVRHTSADRHEETCHAEEKSQSIKPIINNSAIKAEHFKQNTKENAKKQHSKASIGFELMLGALSVASIVGIGITAIAVAAAAPVILGAGILAVSVSTVGAIGVAAHGLFNAYRHENRDKGPSSSPSLTL